MSSRTILVDTWYSQDRVAELLVMFLYAYNWHSCHQEVIILARFMIRRSLNLIITPYHTDDKLQRISQWNSGSELSCPLFTSWINCAGNFSPTCLRQVFKVWLWNKLINASLEWQIASLDLHQTDLEARVYQALNTSKGMETALSLTDELARVFLDILLKVSVLVRAPYVNLLNLS